MEGQSVSGSEQHQSELQSLCVLFTPVTHVVAIRGWEPHSHASNNTRSLKVLPCDVHDQGNRTQRVCTDDMQLS